MPLPALALPALPEPPGAAAAWAGVLVLLAAACVALAHAWPRASASAALRRGWWLLVVVPPLGGAAALVADPGGGARASLALAAALTVGVAALRGAPSRAHVREHAHEAVVAGALVAFLAATVADAALPARPAWLAALGVAGGGLWVVVTAPRAVGLRPGRTRWAWAGLCAGLAATAGAQLLTSWAWHLPAGALLVGGCALAVLVSAEAASAPAHVPRGEQRLAATQIALVAACVLAGPGLLVGTVLTARQAVPVGAGLGAALVAILAVAHLVNLVGTRGAQAWRAQHDALTGLPTEPLLQDRLRQAIAAGRRTGSEFALAFVDLDGFKQVNDTRGHDAGDEVLREVARRLSDAVRESDSVARRSGDEFLVLLTDVAGHDGAEVVGRRLLEALTVPIRVAGEAQPVGASVGLVLWPRDGDDADQLLRNADAAMYEAKDAGRGQLGWYRSASTARTRLRSLLAAQLAGALGTDAVTLDYQAHVDLRDGTVAGLCAAPVWQHPELGPLPLADLAPVVADAGAWRALDRHVLRRAGTRAAEHARTRRLAVPVTVPVSDEHAVRGGLVELVTATLAETGLPATSLALAVGEEALRRGGPSFAETIAALADLGVAVVVRGYGTGDVGIARLSHLRLGGVELDAALVAGTPGVEEPVVAAAIGLADDLGVPTTAAGVADAEQVDTLRALGCVVARGPRLHPQLPAAELDRRLRALAERDGHDPQAVDAGALAGRHGDGPGPATGRLARALDGGGAEAELRELLQRVGSAPAPIDPVGS